MRRPTVWALIGLTLLAVSLQGVQVGAEVGPSESECRPYIEKAIHNLHKTVESAEERSSSETDGDSDTAASIEDDQNRVTSIEDSAGVASQEETSSGDDNHTAEDTQEIESQEADADEHKSDEDDNNESREKRSINEDESNETQENESEQEASQEKQGDEEKSDEDEQHNSSEAGQDSAEAGQQEEDANKSGEESQEYQDETGNVSEEEKSNSSAQDDQEVAASTETESGEKEGDSKEEKNETAEAGSHEEEDNATREEGDESGEQTKEEKSDEQNPKQAIQNDDDLFLEEELFIQRRVARSLDEAVASEETAENASAEDKSEENASIESIEQVENAISKEDESAENDFIGDIPIEVTEHSIEESFENAEDSEQSAEAQSAEAQSAEAEHLSAERKSAEASSAEDQSPEVQSPEDQSPEVHSAEAQSAEDKSEDNDSIEEKPSEDVKETEEEKQSAEDTKSEDDKPSEEDHQSEEEKGSEDDKQSEEEKASEDDKQSAEEHPIDDEKQSEESEEVLQHDAPVPAPTDNTQALTTSDESHPEDDLLLEYAIPENLRDRSHIAELLHLDNRSEDKENAINKVAEVILRDLKRIYENAIKPLETQYKYRDLSNRHFGDPEIFSKPLILFMGPWSGGKSSILNYLSGNEYTPHSLRTGAEPSPAYFNILMHGDEPEVLDGTQLAADWTFSGLQKFGQGLEDRLRGLKLPSKLLEKVNIVEIPGILEVRKQVSRLFPFNDACQWFIDRADVIFLVYDPSKLDVGPETEAILDQLKGREYQTRIILNKADQVKPEELLRVQGALIWNISPLMSSAQPPVMYTTSLWSNPYETGAPTRLLQAQERSFLRDLRTTIDRRIENKIASARRFAVRVRNHAKMVDCYLTTYYNHKSLFGNKKQIADQIIEHPQNYHIYEGLSTLTNISRYDLPDPEVYRDFFRLNPLYEFKKLSETCTYFRGCPINKLDISIAYDLPELVGKYKKLLESSLSALEANEKEKSESTDKS